MTPALCAPCVQNVPAPCGETRIYSAHAADTRMHSMIAHYSIEKAESINRAVMLQRIAHV